MMMPEDAYKDFPLISHKKKEETFIYLDTAATSQKPACVIEAMRQFYLNEYGTVHRAIYDLAAEATEKYSHVREKVAQFIGAPFEDSIIFTSGATEGINLVARSFCKAFMSKGDEILISEAEHHSNIVPWQLVCEEQGYKLKVIPIKESGDLDLCALEKLLLGPVKLISLALITNTTGVRYPVEKVIELAHEKGAKVLLDGAQAAGHVKIDVQKLDCDFLVFSAHKMYGPTGVGVLYGKYELLECMPPCVGGGDMIELVSFEKTTFQKPPLRFEPGTPKIAEVIGLGAALDYLSEKGLDSIEAHEKKLTDYAYQNLKKIPGIKILGDTSSRGALISFVIEDVHPLDLGTMLNLKGVSVRTGQMCASPLMDRYGLHGAVRISFGLYNSLSELDEFFQILRESLFLLKPRKKDLLAAASR